MYTKTLRLGVSVVSLLACFACQTIFASNTDTATTTVKNDINTTKAVVTKHKRTTHHRTTAKKHTKKIAHKKSIQSTATIAPTATVVSVSSAIAPQEFKLKPRFNVWGYTGDRTLAEGQFLIPFYGSSQKAFYGLVEGNVVENDDTWIAGAGLGYRQVVNENIFGAYAKFDYDSTEENQGFWIANPGLEMLGTIWDLRIDGYIPIDSQKSLYKEGWADEFGNFTYAKFRGHREFNHRLKLYEEAGRGFDVEVGRVVPCIDGARMYAGMYHFDTNDAGSNNGIFARVTYDINKYVAVEAKDSYDEDNHNKFLIGIRLTLGGYNKEEKKAFGISSRLMDPIEHTLAGSMIIPAKKKFVDIGEGLEHDNIWFYRKLNRSIAANDIGPQQGSGTYEDPFIGFTPATFNVVEVNKNIGVIDQFPLLYFAPGEYNFQGFSSRGIDERFNLPNGWGMFGRSDDYMRPAIGDERALFRGGLDLNYEDGVGIYRTTLDSIQVFKGKEDYFSGKLLSEINSNFDVTLYVNNAMNVALNNIDIQNHIITNDLGAMGIYANNSQIIMDHTNVLAKHTPVDGDATAIGVYMNNSKLILANSNNITGEVLGGQSTKQENLAYGVYGENQARIEINGNENFILSKAKWGDVNGVNTDIKIAASAIGLYVQDSSVIIEGYKNTILGNASGSNVTIKNSGIDAPSFAWGLKAQTSAIAIRGYKNNILGVANGGNARGLHTDLEMEAFDIGANASATGLYVINSSVMLKGNENVISGIATGGKVRNISNNSGRVDAKAENVYGLYAERTKVIIEGDRNIITAIGKGGSAEMENTKSSGNIIIADAEAFTSVDEVRGLYANDDAEVTITGNGNVFFALGMGGNASANNKGDGTLSATASANSSVTNISGLYAISNSPLTIKGNNNMFLAQGSGGKADAQNEGIGGTSSSAVADVSTREVIGLYAKASFVAIDGDDNLLFAQSFGGDGIAANTTGSKSIKASSDMTCALYAIGSNVAINGSYNGFAAVAIGGLLDNNTRDYGNASGIYADLLSVINFSDTTKGTKIFVNGNTNSTGIFASSFAHLQIAGDDVTNLANFTSLIDFARGGSGGDKIVWENHSTLPW